MKLGSTKSHLLVTTCLSSSDIAIKKLCFIIVILQKPKPVTTFGGNDVSVDRRFASNTTATMTAATTTTTTTSTTTTSREPSPPPPQSRCLIISSRLVLMNFRRPEFFSRTLFFSFSATLVFRQRAAAVVYFIMSAGKPWLPLRCDEPYCAAASPCCDASRAFMLGRHSVTRWSDTEKKVARFCCTRLPLTSIRWVRSTIRLF